MWFIGLALFIAGIAADLLLGHETFERLLGVAIATVGLYAIFTGRFRVGEEDQPTIDIQGVTAHSIGIAMVVFGGLFMIRPALIL